MSVDSCFSNSNEGVECQSVPVWVCTHSRGLHGCARWLLGPLPVRDRNIRQPRRKWPRNLYLLLPSPTRAPLPPSRSHSPAPRYSYSSDTTSSSQQNLCVVLDFIACNLKCVNLSRSQSELEGKKGFVLTELLRFNNACPVGPRGRDRPERTCYYFLVVSSFSLCSLLRNELMTFE